MRVRPALGVLAVLATVWGTLVAPSGAAVAVDPDEVAGELRDAPIYVSPELEDTVSRQARSRLETAFEDAPAAVYLSVVPLFEGDAFDGSPFDYLDAVRERLSEPGLYITFSDGALTAEGYDLPVGLDARVRKADTVANFETAYDAPPATVMLRFLEALEDPNLQARFDRSEAQFGRGPAAQQPPPSLAPRAEDESGSGAWPWLAGGAIVLGAAGLVAGRRGRGARPRPGGPPVLPARVFEHARAAAEEDLHGEARRELVAFSTDLDDREVPQDVEAQEQFQEALDAYGAARATLERASGVLDLAGVLVLVDRGRQALAVVDALADGRRPAKPVPVCLFHPLHGHAVDRVAWTRGLRVPACRACASAVREERRPETLEDGGRPYFEGQGVWARTGYGALADDLVARVLRGDGG